VAHWWRGKEVCIIGADLEGNFLLRHCDGTVRYWDHGLDGTCEYVSPESYGSRITDIKLACPDCARLRLQIEQHDATMKELKGERDRAVNEARVMGDRYWSLRKRIEELVRGLEVIE